MEPTTGGQVERIRQRLDQFVGAAQLPPTGRNASRGGSFDPPREGPFSLAWGEDDLAWAGRMMGWGDETP